ncbi:MAG: serine/threonine-protein kinase [Gammaproteobacteria bacterium]
MSIHASKPAGTRRILIVSESEDLRLLLAQMVAMEWPNAEIHEWDPCMPERTAAAAGRADADVVLVDDALEGAGPGSIGIFPEGLTAHAGHPTIIRLLDGTAPRPNGKALTLQKSNLSRAAVGAVVRAALASATGSDAHWQCVDTVPIGADGETEPLEDVFLLRRNVGSRLEAVRLNGFLMLRKLGSGGMSTIFLAQHLAKGIPMALKILDSRFIEDERFLDLFMREYNLISHIKSPHIVRIYEQGFTDTHVYIAMEYFSRGDLKDHLRYGALPPATALRIFCQVLRALEVIHAHGIVHRDLKPQNLMFREDDSLALIDFGIARHHDATADPEGDGQAPAFGTPYYMSPEQSEGLPGDPRCDLYSAGTILYEMLTGAKPYTGKTAVEVMAQHIGAPMPHLPSAVAAYQPLLERLLAKAPDDRYQNAGELANALDKLSFLPSR